MVTLLLDDDAQAELDQQRAAWFPPERNHVAAHVTLFHALPGEQFDTVAADLRAAAERSPFPVLVAGLRLLGGGVAYRLESGELMDLRARLATAWEPWLTRQDRQRFAPHVTVQNKVAPTVARESHDRLSAGFTPWTATASGLGLWRYLGGPWEQLAEYRFG